MLYGKLSMHVKLIESLARINMTNNVLSLEEFADCEYKEV